MAMHPAQSKAAPADILYALFFLFCTLSESSKSPACPAGAAATELPCIPPTRAVHSPALSHSLPMLCTHWLQPGHVNNDRPFPRLSSLLHRSLDLASDLNSKPVSLRDPPGAAKANQRAIFVFQARARNDSRKAQPGLMELCLCCASKPTFGSGAAWLGRDAAVFAEGNSNGGGGEGRKEKQREMKENEEEEGQPEGAPNLLNVSRLFGDNTWLYSRFPEHSWGCSPERELLTHLCHSAMLTPTASFSAPMAARMLSLAVPKWGWLLAGVPPGGVGFCSRGSLASLMPWQCVIAVCPSMAELCCVAPPAFSPLVMVLRSWLPALLPKHPQPCRKHFWVLLHAAR